MTAAEGLLTTISDRLIKVLPPAFLLLIILNCGFLGVFVWISEHNAEARNLMLTKIVDRCLLERDQRPR